MVAVGVVFHLHGRHHVFYAYPHYQSGNIRPLAPVQEKRETTALPHQRATSHIRLFIPHDNRYGYCSAFRFSSVQFPNFNLSVSDSRIYSNFGECKLQSTSRTAFSGMIFLQSIALIIDISLRWFDFRIQRFR